MIGRARLLPSREPAENSAVPRLGRSLALPIPQEWRRTAIANCQLLISPVCGSAAHSQGGSGMLPVSPRNQTCHRRGTIRFHLAQPFAQHVNAVANLLQRGFGAEGITED